jgi:hypothetical protein
VIPAGSGIEIFSADLPISPGEFVGLDVPPGGMLSMNKVTGTAFGFFGDLTDGSTKHTGSFESELAYFAEIQPVPTIREVAPSSGPTSGGTVVKVIGSDFRGVSSVKFGAIPATSVNVETETSLKAVAPPVENSKQRVDVSVTTVAGASSPTPHDSFEYLPVPIPAATPQVCIVPHLKGMRLKAARRRARRAACGIGRVRKSKRTMARAGFIVRQSPLPGKAVPAGTRIAVKLR